MKVKIKSKTYLVDFKKGLGLFAILIALPLLAAWFSDMYFSWSLIFPIAFLGYFIVKQSLIEFQPYYFDEFGKKILGVKTES